MEATWRRMQHMLPARTQLHGMPRQSRNRMTTAASDGHSYRPALDGIRAVAIFAVLGYHLGYRWVPGGFLGVDVFFVLSGYLITVLLLAEHQETGRISLTGFWLRRARRLLPALFVMILVIALWVHADAPQFELPLRRQDLLWTLFYGANWHFIASGQDYFAQFSSSSPLRHAWSLAVEEQFYLVWPLIVLGVLSVRGKRRWPLGAICAAGVITSAVAMALLYDSGEPSRAYYGTDTRLHQPLIGALLAVFMTRRWSHRPKRVLPSFAAAAATAATIVLLTAFVSLSDTSAAYYSGLSLAVALCAAALIWGVETAPDRGIARLLGLPPVRWVGRISYGLYLWHWPMIIAISSPPALLAALPGSLGMNLTRVLATFGVAAASWSVIEQPIRRGRVAFAASTQRFATGVAMSTALLAPIVFWATEPALGLPLEIAGCSPSAAQPCLRRRGSDGMPVVAVVGDSIARSLDASFLRLAQEHDWTYVLAARGGCRLSHLMTAYRGHVLEAYRACYEETPHLLSLTLETWKPTAVVAMDRFEISDFMGPNGVVRTRTPEHIAAAETALIDVARVITSKNALLAFIELPPTIPGECLKKNQQSALNCQRPVANDIEQIPYNDVFKRLPTRVPHVSTISMTDVICPNGVCRPEVDGIAMRYDGVHFSPAANERLAPVLYQRLIDTGVIPR
jgi:peptidoglycan/LPS O-acetylase OafA/YrhL